MIVLHILALHEVGSNNPDGIETKLPKGSMGEGYESQFKFHEYYTKKYDIIDSIPFHPYGTVKDLIGVAGFLFLFCYVLFFNPEMGGYFLEPPNFEAANPLKTPEHIAPVWYFTPFYAILRAVPDKLLGVIAMGHRLLYCSCYLGWIVVRFVLTVIVANSIYSILPSSLLALLP